jgi:dimethylamine monooxygenase subunit A
MTMPPANAASLNSYFRDGPYRFDIQFGRSTFDEFFSPTPAWSELTGQRKQLLAEFPERHLAVLPESRPLLDETLELARAGRTLPGSVCVKSALELGREWEPDFLLLKRSPNSIRLVCGCVCFPSSWSLAEKIGRPIEEIHGVVPGLNASIGKQIGTFLQRLKPGVAWTRSNWGLSRFPDLNQHPARKLPRLDASVSIDEVFFRVEEQALVALPRSDGVLFGIRLKVFPLRMLMQNESGQHLRRALETMPDAMADYKGLATARTWIIELLRTGAE